MRSDGEGEGRAGTDGRGGVCWGADGGQGVLGLGDVAVRAWRATSSIGVPRWRPVVVACRLLLTCCLLLACCLLLVCCLLFTCCLSSCVASFRMSPPFACRCRRTLSVGGGAGRLRLLMVLGPRRRPWGGPLTIPQRPRDVHGVGARLICYPVCAVVLGLQTRLVKGGGR